jgi:hypothetical protein
MNKVDFKKQDKAFYSGKVERFDLLTVPLMSYLMIDGQGYPGTSQSFVDAVSALYPLAYNIKFHSKTQLAMDYVVPPLEGLWWADDMNAFVTDNKDEWLWTLMLRLPDWITADIVDDMKQQVLTKDKKKKDTQLNPVALEQIRHETLAEGLCVQVLHVGPFSQEGPILKQMHEQFIPENGYTMCGKHHEIYLSDMRKTAPAKLKTILRQPIQKK